MEMLLEEWMIIITGIVVSQERSRDYNADIQIYTIRYAMLEQLRNPPEGRTL